jgi:hypothetical protein
LKRSALVIIGNVEVSQYHILDQRHCSKKRFAMLMRHKDSKDPHESAKHVILLRVVAVSTKNSFEFRWSPGNWHGNVKLVPRFSYGHA